MGRPRFLTTLYGQVLVATLVGVALGHFYPHAGVAMRPLGDGFIKLVRMMIAPIIFCTVVAGVAGIGDTRAVGKAGGLALIYFEVVSTLSLVIGLVVVNLVRPGAGMKGDILQVLLFSVLFGFALHALGAVGRPFYHFIDQLSGVLFRIVAILMKLAPLCAFGAMAFTIGNFGVGSLAQL